MVLSMDRWAGKVAVVTGASAGIGASIAEHLVNAGIKVIGLARRNERVEELAKKLAHKKGKLYSLKCDMTKEEDILKAFRWVEENVGHVHILINNAGIIENTNLLNGDTAKWKNLIDTNVIGLCIATREALKIMKEHNIDGHVIQINSIAGHKAVYSPMLNVYSASKFAVTALTETYRQELKHFGLNNIKITSVSPGFVKTEIAQKIDLKNLTLANAPYLEAEDVTDAVLYALSTPPGVQVAELTIQVLHENI